MYAGVKYRVLPRDEWMANLEEEAAAYPDARRVFLADGDVMARPVDALVEIVEAVRARLPMLSRINLYANGHSILQKSDDELRELHRLGLHTLYMGLESGSDEVLARAHKREKADEMVEAGRRASACGLRMSVMVLAGLGGRDLSGEHAAASARALNRMQPRLLSILCVTPVPGTELFDEIERGEFHEPSQQGIVSEIRALIAGLELEKTVFRANHVSNTVPLQGRLPADKHSLLEKLDALLASGALDADGPGPRPLWL
jgi:radical SAM superfamily enzyme YgiQ (UPF0313 family)